MKRWIARKLFDLPMWVYVVLPWKVIWWAHFNARRID